MIKTGEEKKQKSWRKEDFALSKPLGSGRFGTVFKGVEKASKIPVAIKEMKKKFIQKHNFIHQLRREVEIQYRLNHPNILKLYGYFHDINSVFMVQELAEGGCLYDHLQTKGKLELEEIRRLGFQLLSALYYLQERKVIHRDIKLENILLDKHNNPKLSDFGWAVHAPLQPRSSFCGTILYLSPEMVQKEKYSFKVDVWSLGVLLFEVRAGTPPFYGQNNLETFELIKTKPTAKPDIEPLIQDECLADLLVNVSLAYTDAAERAKPQVRRVQVPQPQIF